jgi:hypothetical protein
MRLFALAALLQALAAWHAASDMPVIAQEGPALAIDVGTGGNSGTSYGEIEDCVSVETGARFDVDVLIMDVADLLAWEVNLDYNPTVLEVVDQDVKLFLGGNEGSSPIDLSAKLPDDSGFHSLSAFESSDPPTPDTGSGVLARVTLEATGEGESDLGFGERDLDANGDLDRGTLLKDVDAKVIGDESGDDYFDGETTGAVVVVGDDCPDGTNAISVAGAEDSSESSSWVYVAAALGAAALALVAGAVVVIRRRRRSAA